MGAPALLAQILHLACRDLLSGSRHRVTVLLQCVHALVVPWGIRAVRGYTSADKESVAYQRLAATLPVILQVTPTTDNLVAGRSLGLIRSRNCSGSFTDTATQCGFQIYFFHWRFLCRSTGLNAFERI